MAREISSPRETWKNAVVGTLPAVSVLLPVFNAEAYLDASLSSLAAQSLRDFEIVAVDDGSTDSTLEILASWSRREPRLRVVRQAHAGLVAALNAGLDHCGGELLARMDADDVSRPDRLKLQRQGLADRPEIDVLSCRVTHFAKEEVGVGFRIYEKWLNSLLDDDAIRRELFIESPLPHPSVMVRRSVLQDVGGYRDVGWPEDYDLWLRLAAKGHRFAKLPQTLLEWRDHDRRLTRTDRRYSVERFLECKAHYLANGPLRGQRRVIVWGAGQTGRRLSKYLLRHQVPIDAFIDIDPRKCGRTMRNRPIIPPERFAQFGRSGDERPVILAAVSSRGARAKIRERLEKEGWQETRDFWCVA
jgi:glycosyltransferase involved in cell wall biosynthesis